MDKKYKYLYIVSVLMLLTGAALAMTRHIVHIVFDIIYTLGALGYTLYYVLAPLKERSHLIRRVTRMGAFSGLLFLLSAIARFGVFDAYGRNAWLLFLALGLVYMCYGNVLLYLRERKSKK